MKLPYALVGRKLAQDLLHSATKKTDPSSVFHGMYLDKGGKYLDYQCVGDPSMHSYKSYF